MTRIYFYLTLTLVSFFSQGTCSAGGFGETGTFSIQEIKLPDYNLLDLAEASISNNGDLLFRSNLSGDFRSYSIANISGKILKDYPCNKTIGQYYILPFFTPHNTWVLLNSALGSNRFGGPARLDIVDRQGNIQMSVDARSLSGWPSVFGFSPDEKMMAFAKDDNTVVLYNFTDGREEFIKLEKDDSAITDITFHPNGRWMATKSAIQGDVVIWELATKQKIAVLSSPEEQGDISDQVWIDDRSVYFSEDGKFVVTSASDVGKFVLWDAVGKVLAKDFSLFNQIRVSPQNRFIAIGNRVFDQKTGNFTMLNVQGDHSELAVAYSYDDRLLAMGKKEKLFIFETTGFENVTILQLLDNSAIQKIAFSDNNHFYVIHESGRLFYVSLTHRR